MKPVGHLFMYVDEDTLRRDRLVRFARTGDARLFRPISERTHDAFFAREEPWPSPRSTGVTDGRRFHRAAYMVTWLVQGGALAGEYYSKHKIDGDGLLDAEDWRAASACAAQCLMRRVMPDDQTLDQFAERRLQWSWMWEPTKVEIEVLARRALRKGLVGR